MRRTTLDDLLSSDEPVIVPGVWDPLMGRIFQRMGAKCLTVGGWITGASLAVTEPLLTMTEQVEAAGRVARAVEIPVIVDGHTGYGEPVHVTRAIREFEAAGIDCVHLEDQHFPKRAHYHQAQKHVVPLPAMVEKLVYACRARHSKAFKIIARTDAHGAIGGSLDEAIARLQAYKEAGADMVMPFPSPGDYPEQFNIEVLKRVRGQVPDIPMVWVAGEARDDRDPDIRAAFEAGYKIILFPTNFLIASVQRTMQHFSEIQRNGKALLPDSDQVKLEIESAIGLPELYAIERETTERPAAETGGPTRQARR
jgi:2-methylisocitrate lyase-like PEP mutase family enzyme